MKLISKIFLSLLFLTATAFAQKKSASLVLEEYQDAQKKPFYILIIEGSIVSPLASKIKDVLAGIKAKAPLLLMLDSSGGGVDEGMKIIDLVKSEKAKGRTVTTSVENGMKCASMCVQIFAQGEKRYAGEVSAFMLHGAAKTASTNVPNEAKTREQLKILSDAGVSTSWLDKLWAQKVFSVPGAYWLSGRELIDAKANLVTNAISRFQIDKAHYATNETN